MSSRKERFFRIIFSQGLVFKFQVQLVVNLFSCGGAALKCEMRIKISRREMSQAQLRHIRIGKGHPVWQMTYYKDGRQFSKHIPNELVYDVMRAIRNGRKIERVLASKMAGRVATGSFEISSKAKY